MSGKYLHGLIIDSDFVYVRDNVFSHSELREDWLGIEKKHRLIEEWSWDYVSRKFVETDKRLIPVATQWILKNLQNHKQLVNWIDRNWEGLVNGDEKERGDYIWRLISNNATHKDKLVLNFLKAAAEWKKAAAEWKKAAAEWKKADAEWKKADAECEKADAEWKKADAECEKADAEWKKAAAEWKKADAEWKKADKKWKTNIMKPIFLELLEKYPNKIWRCE